MLKLKKSEEKINDDAFDLVPISTIKKINKVHNYESDFDIINVNNDIITNDKDNLIDTFINLLHQIPTKPTTDSSASKALKTFLKSTSLWELLLVTSSEEFKLINSTLIHCYFRIPDRISCVHKLETDEFFFPKSFQHFTQESLQSVLLREKFTSSKFQRFVKALEKIDGFGLEKLVKISEFWDSLIDPEFKESFSSNDSLQNFLRALFKNLLNRNFSFKHLVKIIKKLNLNLKSSFAIDNLNNLFVNQFIAKGSLDYREFSKLLASFCLISISNTSNVDATETQSKSNVFILNLLDQVLKIWSNDSWISRTPFTIQLHYSSCLIIILSIVSPEMFQYLPLIEQNLMNGIQSRLDHSDSQIRLIATYIAETLNQLYPTSDSDKKLDFSLDSSNEIVCHLRICYSYIGSFLFDEFESMNPITMKRNTSVTCNNFDFLKTESTEMTDDDDDLKPISCLLKEELDPPKNAKIPLPRFLADSLKVLRSNEDPEIVEKVLNRLSNTFKTSSKLSRQLHATSAFNTVLNLLDKFEISDFDPTRLSIMKELLVDQIKEISPELIEGMFQSNKLVLNQKMELMIVICGAAQEIFRPKHLNSSGDDFKYPNLLLNYFEKSFLISENSGNSKLLSNSKSKNSSIDEFIEHLCVPFLIHSIRSFEHFKRNHLMFLEKFLWLQGIILNFSRNYLSYDRVVERYLDFVHLLFHSSYNNNNCVNDNDIDKNYSNNNSFLHQIPVQKALLIGLSVVLTSWPANFPVLQFYSRLQEIYTFLNEIVAVGPGFQEDQQLQALGTSVALALQDLTDHQKMLKESTEQMEFDLKSIRVSQI